MTLDELLIKPAFEGLAEYGVASALGVKDAEAQNGAKTGAYLAPFTLSRARDLLGASDELTALFNPGNTSYNSYVTGSVSGQITSIAGGIAAAIYDGNYQMGAYGVSQVFTYNDHVIVEKNPNADGSYNIDIVDDSNATIYYGVGTTLTPGLVGAPISFNSAITQSGTFFDRETVADNWRH